MRRRADDALSSGRAAEFKYSAQAYDALLAMCNAYEEREHALQRTMARMAERCDRVDVFEAANERQLIQHAAETATLRSEKANEKSRLTIGHQYATERLHEAHAEQMRQTHAAHEVAALALHNRMHEAAEAARAERAALEAAHEVTVQKLDEAAQAREEKISQIQASLETFRRAAGEFATAKAEAEAAQRRAEGSVQALFSMLLRLSSMLAEAAELNRTHRAAAKLQRLWRVRSARREAAAQRVQTARRQQMARQKAALDARLAEEEARRARETRALEAQVATMRTLNENLGKAAALSAALDKEKLDEQDQKMRDMEEEANRATLNIITLLDAATGVEVALREGIVAVFGTHFVRAHLEHHLEEMRMVAAAQAQTVATGGGRFANDVGTLILGDPQKAALGLFAELKVDMFDLFGLLAKGVGAIIDEVEKAGTDEDKECLEYVLNQQAGTSDKIFHNSAFPRDCDADGVRPDRVNPETGEGMWLADFVNHPSARTARLVEAHVLALRLYSTAAFRSLNGPLRDRSRTTPHPFAATVFFLADAIKKLRTVEANRAQERAEARAKSPEPAGAGKARPGLTRQNAMANNVVKSGANDDVVDLWRGMKNLASSKEFLENGGSEAALMSTTSELQVAVGYALSPHSLLFKIRTSSFMQRGADIQFLSAFPAEAEFLYPPLTFLKPTGRSEVVRITPHVWGGGGSSVKFTVIEVEPQMA